MFQVFLGGKTSDLFSFFVLPSRITRETVPGQGREPGHAPGAGSDSAGAQQSIKRAPTLGPTKSLKTHLALQKKKNQKVQVHHYRHFA